MNNKEIIEKLDNILGCLIGSHTSCQTPEKQLEYLIEELKAKNNEVLDLVSCCDNCGKELTNIGGSQMYCHTCGTTKIGCN